MTNRNAILSKLRLAKARLGQGGPLGRLLVPVVEVCEFLLSHGVREVVARSKVRLGMDGSRRTSGLLSVGRLDQTAPLTPLVIPSAGSPVVSFVVSHTDDAFLTHHALAAIVADAAPGTYEIILVTASKRAGIADLLARTTGVTEVVEHEDPPSATALNRAVDRTRGTFVSFLESRSGVLAGSLGALVDLLQRIPQAGAAGPVVVDEDAHVLSAGSIVWTDGTVTEYGRGLEPSAPDVSFVREVDACSLVGLVVRRAAFTSIGGFAPEYAPTDYGRLDLAFRLRAAGCGTWYQPAAAVVWRGGPTTTASGPDGHDASFRRRHAMALSQQRPSGDVRGARDRHRGLRILIVDSKMPRPDRDSGSVRLTAILRMLVESGRRLTFVAEASAGDDRDRSRLQQLGVEVIHGPASARYLAQQHAQFDVVILCRMAVAAKGLEQLQGVARRPLVIFDTVDLHFVREERQAKVEQSAALAAAAEKTRATELDLMRSSDRVWITSAFEADLLRAEPGLPPLDLVPNVHEVRADVPPFAGREHILFVGGFLHPPNEDAVLYFVQDIFPHVRARLPSVQLLVVGSDMPRRIQNLHGNGVVVRGHVPDLEPLFEGCRLSVAPLRYGAGVKGKVTQSLAQGLPVVATSVAAEGLDLVSGEHLFVADDPAAFAERVIELYTDEALWTRLSLSGRRHIEARLGYDSVKNSLNGLFETLEGREPR